MFCHKIQKKSLVAVAKSWAESFLTQIPFIDQTLTSRPL